MITLGRQRGGRTRCDGARFPQPDLFGVTRQNAQRVRSAGQIWTVTICGSAYQWSKTDQWRSAPHIRRTPHFVVSPVHSIHRASDRQATLYYRPPHSIEATTLPNNRYTLDTTSPAINRLRRDYVLSILVSCFLTVLSFTVWLLVWRCPCHRVVVNLQIH